LEKRTFTAVIEKDLESNCYIGIVPGISGAHTQADTIDELIPRLKEVVELCLEEMDEEDRKLIPEFIGVVQIAVSV
jgi:predicted RNase H-like HicB family nuclease